MEENDQTNLRLCRLVRHTFGVDNVIVWVQEPTQNDRFRALGVRVLNPAYSTVLILERMVLNPALADITPDMDASQTVREVKLQNSQFIDWRLADLKLPGDVLVLMIERKGDVLVPQRDTVLRANDNITLVGTATHINDAMRLFVRNE